MGSRASTGRLVSLGGGVDLTGCVDDTSEATGSGGTIPEPRDSCMTIV